jgi:hypothetical protein
MPWCQRRMRRALGVWGGGGVMLRRRWSEARETAGPGGGAACEVGPGGGAGGEARRAGGAGGEAGPVRRDDEVRGGA